MKYLVTGAAGFIGSHLCRLLATDSENQIVGVDNFSDYYSPSLKRLRATEFLRSDRIDFIEGDFAEPHFINRVVQKFRPETVLHLGAQAGVRLQPARYHDYVHSNEVGFGRVLVSVIQNDVKNFVYASSSSVYGDKATIPLCETEKSLNPSSFYGTTKLSNEIQASSMAQKFGFRARGLRFFTVYGPWGRPDMAYFRIIASLIHGERFRQFGDGSIKRDFTFVDDNIRITYELANELASHPPGFSDIVNIGGGNPYSLIDLIDELERYFPERLQVDVEKADTSDVRVTHASTNYLSTLIDNPTFTTLSDGLVETIKWSREKGIVENLVEWTKSVP